MRLSQNLLAGLVNSVWSAVVGLAVVPFYIKYLGIEAYGLIGFFVTFQAIFQLLDMGLAPTINREVARGYATKKMQSARNLLHTLATIYWLIAVIIAAFIYYIAPYIAKFWFQTKSLQQNNITQAVMLMGLIIASRWPVGLYMGALMGAQRLTITSGVNIVAISLANIGAIFILVYVSPTIQAFFIWQAMVGFIYAVSMRFFAWRIIGNSRNTRFEVNEIKRIWRFSAGMMGVSTTGLVLLQIDKLLLSKLLTLDDFGRYALASVVASGLYVLLTPMFNAVYPRMSVMVAKGNFKELLGFYKDGTRLFLAILFPIAISISVFSDKLLYVWTEDQSLAIIASPIVSLLVMGTALNGAMHFPYALQLAFGESRLPLKINIILLSIMIPSIIVFVKTYGALGGAIAWAITNSVYLVVGTYITHNKILKGNAANWLFGDVGVPMIVALVFSGFGGVLVRYFNFQNLIEIFCILALACIAFMLTVISSPRLRSQVLVFKLKI